LSEMVNAVNIPVTLKMRTGWSPAHKNATTIAKMAEDVGVAALVVHGRTRACAFGGAAEYDTIAEIAGTTNLPVFANGDIDSPQKAAAVLDRTGAEGVMIGRAAQGKPWLCGEIAHFLETGTLLASPEAIDQLTILRNHVEQLHSFYGAFMGVRIARKHVGWYLQNRTDSRALRSAFNALECTTMQIKFIDQLMTESTDHGSCNRSYNRLYDRLYNKELAA